MNSNEMMPIVPKNMSSGVIDNSEYILKGFWERSEGAPNRKKKNGVEKALEIIESSTEALYVCTPRIAAKDLLIALERKQKSGVRTYFLVRDLDTHYSQKIFEHFGVARERTDITSTCVVSDPKGDCHGIWFNGDLSSKNSSYPMILTLNRGQAYDAYCHFTHLWWKSEGDEVRDNRKLKTKPMHPKTPEYASSLSSAFRIDALDKNVPDSIREISLASDVPEVATIFLDESETLSCLVSEKSREYIDDADRVTIAGFDSLPFCFISGAEKTVAFSRDYGFLLDERQKTDVLNYTQNPEWNYHREKEIGRVRGKILPSESNWDEKTAVSIEPTEVIQLDDIFTKSIDDWVGGECRPEYPDMLRYAKSIEYTWRVVPPVLPGNAKKHALYGQWNEFETRLRKSCQEVHSVIEKYEGSLEGMQKITKKNLISDWSDLIASLVSVEWTKETDVQKAGDALKTLGVINEAISRESEEVEKSGGKDGETNEYAASSGKKNAKKNIKKNIVSKKVSPGTISIPKKPLPEVGVLYRVGNDDFLAIKNMDEIEPAKEEVLKYTNCRLVAEKTW